MEADSPAAHAVHPELTSPVKHIGYGYDVWGNRSAVELPTWNQNGANCTTRSHTHLDAEWDGPWLERAWLSDAVSPAESVLQYALYQPSGRPIRLALGTGVAFLREVEDPDGMARPLRIYLHRYQVHRC